MANKKSKPTDVQFKSLCDYKDGKYISKSGDEYIKSLEKLFDLENKNDIPFTKKDILEQPNLQEFKFDGVNDYIYICDLTAKPLEIEGDKRTNERIIAENFQSKERKLIFNNSLGVSYLITCPINDKEYIIKIGQTRTSFKKRLGSYNCGVVNNWRTASTTNIKILQSILTTRLKFKLYIYDCSDEPYTITWHGIKSIKLASPKALAVEDIMLKEFIKMFDQKPLANIQAEATEN